MAAERIDVFFKTLGVDPSVLNNGGTKPIATGSSAEAKKTVRELEKGNKGQKKGLGATLGIKFGIASLLKQSQVFTGFVGTIFQLMGALVDVILAPFLPILIPGIRLIASMIPYVSRYAQKIFDFLDRTLFQWFRGLPIPDWIKENVKKALSAILVGVVMLKITGLWNVFKSLVDTFIGKPLWGLLTKMFPQIDGIVAKFAGKTFGEIVEMGGKAAINAVIRPMWNTFLVRMGTLVDFVATPFKALWTALRPGAEKMMGATLDDLVRRVWTQGLKLHFVTPFLMKIAGIAAFIASPFKGLWGTITGDVATAGDSLIGRGLLALRRMPMVEAILNIPHALTGYAETALNWLVNDSPLKVLKDVPKYIRAFWKDFPTLIGRLPVVGEILKFIAKKIGGILGGAFKAVRGAATKLGGILKPSKMLTAAKGLKAIPIIGAIAELGFGGWATYKDFVKYGPKAAAGRAALTIANATTALFDPTGLASAAGSIASNIAMDQIYKRTLDPTESYKLANPDLWIKVEGAPGEEMVWRKTANQNSATANVSPSMPKDRPTMEYLDVPGM